MLRVLCFALCRCAVLCCDVLCCAVLRCMCLWLQSNPGSGITSNAYVVLVGLASASWPLMGYDSVAHLIEETKSADSVAGRPMPWAVGASFCTGLIYILTLTLCIQVRLPKTSLQNHHQNFSSRIALLLPTAHLICPPKLPCSDHCGYVRNSSWVPELQSSFSVRSYLE